MSVTKRKKGNLRGTDSAKKTPTAPVSPEDQNIITKEHIINHLVLSIQISTISIWKMSIDNIVESGCIICPCTSSCLPITWGSVCQTTTEDCSTLDVKTQLKKRKNERKN